MIPNSASPEDPVMSAATQSLLTGDVRHILIWTSMESESTLRNLVEKTCCAWNQHKDPGSPVIAWYFRTVARFHAAFYGSRNLNLSGKTPEERRIILLAERAFERGSFEDLQAGLRDISCNDLREHFYDVLSQRQFPAEDTAAGRAYIASLAGFIDRMNSFYTKLPSEDGV